MTTKKECKDAIKLLFDAKVIDETQKPYLMEQVKKRFR